MYYKIGMHPYDSPIYVFCGMRKPLAYMQVFALQIIRHGVACAPFPLCTLGQYIMNYTTFLLLQRYCRIIFLIMT